MTLRFSGHFWPALLPLILRWVKISVPKRGLLLVALLSVTTLLRAQEVKEIKGFKGLVISTKGSFYTNVNDRLDVNFNNRFFEGQLGVMYLPVKYVGITTAFHAATSTFVNRIGVFGGVRVFPLKIDRKVIPFASYEARFWREEADLRLAQPPFTGLWKLSQVVHVPSVGCMFRLNRWAGVELMMSYQGEMEPLIPVLVPDPPDPPGSIMLDVSINLWLTPKSQKP